MISYETIIERYIGGSHSGLGCERIRSGYGLMPNVGPETIRSDTVGRVIQCWRCVAICVAVRSRTEQHQTTRPVRFRKQDGTKQHPLGLDRRHGRD